MMFYNCVRQLIYSFLLRFLLSFNVTVFLLSVFAWCFMFFMIFILLNLNALVMAILYSNIRTVTKKGGQLQVVMDDE
ncbi:Uncharacterised protein [Escherichia coli]|nr:Uncharacterised protein [Escherichia coli]CTZ32625.1 Uncharacterised protein [Escherichia coli]